MKVLLGAMVDSLPEKQKEVVQMYYMEGKKMPEIACLLGVNKSSVQRRLTKAIEEVKKIKRIIEKVAL